MILTSTPGRGWTDFQALTLEVKYLVRCRQELAICAPELRVLIAVPPVVSASASFGQDLPIPLTGQRIAVGMEVGGHGNGTCGHALLAPDVDPGEETVADRYQ